MKTNLPNIDNLTYSELKELSSLVSARLMQLWPEWRAEENSRYQKERDKRIEKQNDFIKNVLPKIIEFVRGNLMEGDYIKVSGTRDGKGIRKLLSVGKNGIECRQVIIRQSLPTHSGQFTITKETLGQVTEHQFDKITHVKVNNRWERIKDLIK